MSILAPIQNIYSADWHREKFLAFTQAKALVGEPSPHMTVVKHLSAGISQEEAIWRAGCYATPYSVLTAEALWTAWPWIRVVQEGDAGLLPWITEHWSGIHTRIERRGVRTPEKFVRCLLSYRDWAKHALPNLLEREHSQHLDSHQAYDALWDSADSIYNMGRYIIIRLLELLRREGLTKAELYDIRSIGGWSPVRALTLFYPEYSHRLLAGDITCADTLAYKLLDEMQAAAPGIFTPYVIAAMLCEMRVAFENAAQYAGWTIDQEIEYHNKYSPYWQSQGFAGELLTARAALFPSVCLGELNGWDGRRTELKPCYRNGVVWSDMKYDYKATKEAGSFMNPVLRAS